MRHASTRTGALAAASALAIAASPALAGDLDYSHYSSVIEDGDALRQSEEAISAEALFEGGVWNFSRTLQGDLTDIVLDGEGQVSFVTYAFTEAPQPTDQASYATPESFTFARDGEDMTVQLSADMDAGAPEDMTISETEADRVLVSRILESDVRIAGEDRPIDDLLFSPEGEVEMALIDRDGDALTADTLAVPFDALVASPDGVFRMKEDVAPGLLIIAVS